MRGFIDASVRQDAARDARLLSLIAVGTRGDAQSVQKALDQTLDRLTGRAERP